MDDNPVGQLQHREITKEMEESYLDYAMSVIVARALPDVRDGLKPVHRRILYTMHEMGLTAGAHYRKSAAIVGDALGKYHPHGDAALYDSMARLAQDFSMRYPLVDGQGNFGCFTKDTEVKLTDGRSVNFEQLIQEDAEGKKNFTYTVNKPGLISIAAIKYPRKTRSMAELVQVVLDNGRKIRCTPNHRFMMRDGSYRTAETLVAGDSLMPLYERLSEKKDRLNREGYLLVYQPKKDEWVPAHHLADNYNLIIRAYQKSAGRVRHHKDFNKLNNNPTNIARISWGEHWKIHYQHAVAQHADPIYRQKIAEGRTKFWSQSSVREAYAERISQRNKANWQDPAYRENMRKFLSKSTKAYIEKHPEKRKEFSARATATLKRLWEKPSYRSFMHEKILKGNRNHLTNNTGKKKFLTICKEALRLNPLLDERMYEQARKSLYPYGAATKWETGLEKYFQNDPSLILQEINRNHKVVKVERLKEKEDVYDLTIDGTHNFALADGIFVHNSIDGDSPAAMRYTEARMTKIAGEMLRDIDKDTVPWVDNYDGTRKEPQVLPAALPQLLLNGTMGIAVGMATNIPPHNLGEVVDALIHLIDHPKATTEDLFQFVQGPDFPTGGTLYGKKSILEAYGQGKGPMLVRGEAEVHEEGEKRGVKGTYIEITEIPYQVNKAALIEKIAELVQDGRLEGIRDVRDESDKDGMSVIIELKKDAHPQKVLNNLYKFTELQKTFHLNMLALVDGIQPQVLSLKGVLEHYLAHKFDVVRKRTEFDLARARERAHILEGLKKALDHIDAVIKTIRASADREDAHKNLKKKFAFSDVQANAILDMRLQNLANLERQKVEDELKEKQRIIKELTLLLKDEKRMRDKIKEEFKELKERYGDERKTKVRVQSLGEFREEDLIPNEETIVLITRDGYIKRVAPNLYQPQHRGGKGIMGIANKGEDLVEHFFAASTHDRLLFFTSKGRVFQTIAYEIPRSTRVGKGKALVNFLDLEKDELVTAVIPLERKNEQAVLRAKATEGQAKFLVMATKNGIIKKTEFEQFEAVRRSGLIALHLRGDDALRWVSVTSGKDEIMLATREGQSVRFGEKDVRPMGRTAAGVAGIRLHKGDAVVGMDVVNEKNRKSDLLVVMENGYGKRTGLLQFKTQHRGGSGIKAAQITQKTGQMASAHVLADQEELIVVSQGGNVIRTKISDVPRLGRATQGVRIMKLNAGDKIASAIIV